MVRNDIDNSVDVKIAVFIRLSLLKVLFSITIMTNISRKYNNFLKKIEVNYQKVTFIGV
jgi:hypothetical protein